MTHSPSTPSSLHSLKHFGGYCSNPTDIMVDSNNNNNYKNHESSSPSSSNVNSSNHSNYDRFEEFGTQKISNEIINLIDMNKYSKLGLSHNSQELIGEFYQLLVSSHDLTRATKPFEEIIYSMVEDIQSFKKETHRLEDSIKADKERNEEILKHMIEEADHQLSQATEMINLERRREKEQFEKTIEKLKEHYNMEIYNLQESLEKMKQMEAKYEENKTKEGQRIAQLNDEIRNLIDENVNLKKSLSDCDSLVASLKTKINQLEQDVMHEDAIKKHSTYEASIEIQSLREELRNMSEEHQKLIDKNDALKEEIENLRNANTKSAAECCAEHQPNNINLSQEHTMVAAMNGGQSGMFSPNFQATIESDEDIEIQENRRSLNHHQHQRRPSNPHLNVDKRKRNLSESHSSEIEEGQDSGHNKSERLSLAKKLLTEKLESKTEKRSKIAKLVSLTNRTKPADTTLSVQIREKLPEKVLRIAVVGDQAVGKTSFVTRFCKGQFQAASPSCSTQGVDFHMKMLDLDGKAVALQLWDTCGQERFRSIAKSYFRRADGIVLMYDCNYERSFLNMREWIQIINEQNDKRIPIILVGNKTDLREANRATSTKPCVEYEDGWKLAKEFSTLFVETSAKEGTNMDDESLSQLIRSAVEQQELDSTAEAIQRQIECIEKMQSEELVKISKLSSEVEQLARENKELKELFTECQTSNKMLKCQIEALQQTEQTLRNALAENERASSQTAEEQVPKKKGSHETKALHNAYKKLNNINDLLRDEIENIKLKASKIAEKDSLAYNSGASVAQKSC